MKIFGLQIKCRQIHVEVRIKLKKHSKVSFLFLKQLEQNNNKKKHSKM